MITHLCVCIGLQVVNSFHAVHGGPHMGVCVRLFVWAGSVAVAQWLHRGMTGTPRLYDCWHSMANTVLSMAHETLNASKVGNLRENAAL